MMRLCSNCKTRHAKDTCCPVHIEARTIGQLDGEHTVSTGAARWPPGTYGHADYWLGFYEGVHKHA